MKLTDSVSALNGVGDKLYRKLKILGIETIEDLLHHIPSHYSDFRNVVNIDSLKIGEQVTLIGQIISIQNINTKNGKLMQIARISDGEATVEAIWLNQPFLTKVLPVNTLVSISGKVGFWGRKRAIAFPQYEKITSESPTIHTGKLVPTYPETEGVTSKWIRRLINNILTELNAIEEFISKEELTKLKLTEFKTALHKIHKPKDYKEVEIAKKRLSFNELLLLQIESNLERIKWQKNTKSYPISLREEEFNKYLNSMPFKLTSSQTRSIGEIRKDLTRNFAMNRLLEGDVGSGKTVVAAFGVFAAIAAGFQAALMAPTQILAEQHYQTFKTIFKDFNFRIASVTGQGIEKGVGSIDLFIGTHALLHKPELFEKTALLIIDEQHRFGVKQRATLIKHMQMKKIYPHVLTMTATPIPRTIALTLYGDLDLSTLDELPKGRQKITTWVVPPKKRKGAEKWISKQIEKDRVQVFIVCPLIEESDKDKMKFVKAVKVEYERLNQVFTKFKLGLLHGKMKPKEKSKVIEDFKAGKIDILVTTPVIEVGVDIPNATIMVIEGADRFGLAQLHQLRGRVGRGTKKSYCLLFTSSKSASVKDKLNHVSKANSGRELAELDLKLRGPGEVFGIRQHGLPELKIASWDDFELIKLSKDFSDHVVKKQKKYHSVIKYYKTKQVARN